MRTAPVLPVAALSALAAVAALFAPAPAAGARAQQAPSPFGGPALSGEAMATMQNIHDLTLLNALIPLRLTREQIDALLVPLREAAKLDAARRKQDEEALKVLAAEIAQARTAALDGQDPPKELEDRVAALGKESAARLEAARKEAIEKVLPVAKAFTEAQREEIEEQSRAFFGGKRVPAQYRRDPSKAPKEAVQELALRAFIQSVLLDERTPALLEKLKPMPAAEPAAPASDGVPAAAPPAANP